MATYMMIPPEIIFSRFVFIVVLFTLTCTKLLWNHLKVPKDNPKVCRAWTVFRNIRPHQTDPGGGTYFCDISSLCFVSQFVSTQMETALTISRANQSHVSCVRVRGRTNIFCADQGFWSEWTQDCFSVSRKEDKQLFILIPVILSLSISLIIFMLIGQCKKRPPAGKPLHASVGC